MTKRRNQGREGLGYPSGSDFDEGQSMRNQSDSTQIDDSGQKGGRARAGMYSDDTGSEGMNNENDTSFGFDDDEI